MPIIDRDRREALEVRMRQLIDLFQHESNPVHWLPDGKSANDLKTRKDLNALTWRKRNAYATGSLILTMCHLLHRLAAPGSVNANEVDRDDIDASIREAEAQAALILEKAQGGRGKAGGA